MTNFIISQLANTIPQLSIINSQLSIDKLGDLLVYQRSEPMLFSSGLFFFLLSVS